MLTRRGFAAGVGLGLAAGALPARADDILARQADIALQHLYRSNSVAAAVGEKAVAILVFPEIVKAGFLVGGQGGSGVLFRAGQAVAQYRLLAASYGLQVGVQWFGYALFFMDEDAVSYLDRSEGWEVGVGPSLVIVDKGVARSMSTTTLQDGVYAFIFDQEGLMAGVGLQGSKITRTK